MRKLLFLAFAALILPPELIAHGALHERIDILSESVRESPDDASLYWQRGELYRNHGEAALAEADFRRALVIDPALDVVYLGLAVLHLENGDPQAALQDLSYVALAEAGNGEGLKIRGRAHAALENYEQAVKDYDRALAVDPAPRPDDFLERARFASMVHPGGVRLARQGLDEAIDRLGPLVTLTMKAIDFDLKLGDVDRALLRIEIVMPQFDRKETLLVKRGNILALAGRIHEAQAAYTDALDAIDSISSSRRGSDSYRELQSRIRLQINDLSRISGKGTASE